MIPGEYNIEIYKGGTWEIVLEGKNSTGSPTDFSIYDEITLEIYAPWIEDITGVTPLLAISKTTGEIVITNNLITITIAASVTNQITFTEGKYSLKLIQNTDLTATPPITEPIIDVLLQGTVLV